MVKKSAPREEAAETWAGDFVGLDWDDRMMGSQEMERDLRDRHQRWEMVYRHRFVLKWGRGVVRGQRRGGPGIGDALLWY